LSPVTTVEVGGAPPPPGSRRGVMPDTRATTAELFDSCCQLSRSGSGVSAPGLGEGSCPTWGGEPPKPLGWRGRPTVVANCGGFDSCRQLLSCSTVVTNCRDWSARVAAARRQLSQRCRSTVVANCRGWGRGVPPPEPSRRPQPTSADLSRLIDRASLFAIDHLPSSFPRLACDMWLFLLHLFLQAIRLIYSCIFIDMSSLYSCAIFVL
jgi:hypothetical protein